MNQPTFHPVFAFVWVVAWRKRYCKEQRQVHADEEDHVRTAWMNNIKT